MDGRRVFCIRREERKEGRKEGMKEGRKEKENMHRMITHVQESNWLAHLTKQLRKCWW